MLQSTEDAKKMLRSIKKKAEVTKRSTQLFFAKLRRVKPRDLDKVTNRIDTEVFAETNCMACANCCKVGTPVFSRGDISRLAKHLRLDEDVFYEKYLLTDDEDDIIFKKQPCVFLDKNNMCTVYEHRPDDCRNYPHTGTRKIVEKLEMLLDNTFICPAANEIVDRMKTHYQHEWKQK